MEYTEIIYLIKEEKIEDEIGNVSSSSVLESKCYAKKQSVKTNEFYNATMAGFNPSIEFVIKRNNYNEETQLKWNNEIYSVIRTIDSKSKFDIVLVCSKKIGVK